MQYDEFNYWFTYKNQDFFNVIDKNSNEIIGEIKKEGINQEIRNYEDEYKSILDEFEQFQERDEYIVGTKYEYEKKSVEESIHAYKSILKGAIQIRATKNGLNPDEQDRYIQNILTWVNSSDFYEAPASTRYHDAYPHGLLSHTFRVYNEMCDLITLPKFSSIAIDSAAIVCLVHDWCKIGLYEKYLRNVKDENTGVWNSVESYRRKKSFMPLGHGVLSMYLANRFIKLTEAESLAIRWHMGRWYVDESSVDDLQQANENYPLVHLLQFADQLAIVNY